MSKNPSLLLRILAALAIAGFAATTGCDDSDNKDTPAATETGTKTDTGADTTKDTTKDETVKETTPAPAPAAAKSVTGNWYYKKEIMRLKQTGSSIQGTTEVIGFVNNPADPIESPVRTVGSMQANGTVKLTELVTYLANPSKSFNVVKSGGLKDANTLVLNVTSGQAPHTQTWIKK
ncbi:MAG: hypothetical protein U1G05_18120 [Kiritimatiellia bacterium]